MAKRCATTDLNHDNWDAKEEEEDPGSFTPLSGPELQKRVIKKAKRSLNTSASGNSPAPSSPFAKFSGFSSTAASSPFFSAVNKTNSPFLAVPSATENPSKSPFPLPQEKTNNKDNTSFFSTIKKEKEETPNGKTEEESNLKNVAEDTKKSTSSSASLPSEQTQARQNSRGVEYCKKLRSLNESVLKWMQLHLAKNACSDFTPVFNDYKKHIDTLNTKYPARKVESATLQQGVFKKPYPSTDNSASTAQSNFPKKEAKQQQDETDYGAHFSSNTTNTSTFSFGMKLTPTASSSDSPLGPNSSSKEGALQNNEETKPQFSASFFSQSSKEENKGSSPFSAGFFSQNAKPEDKGSGQFSAGFFSKALQSSGADKPFSFATAPIERSAGAENDEEYVPPKNEFVAVSEEDAVYSKRCKLFFKKDDAFADKGVGTLYVKSLEDTTQLLIRADTSLGNILLNIRLSASLPISRNGKNNVMICCIPNPPADVKNPDKVIPLLIRVKTSEDADELLETLNKYKS